VVAGPFAFVDVGTVFSVSWRAGVAELEVSEGAVEVWRAGGKLAVVREGRWSSAELRPAARDPGSAGLRPPRDPAGGARSAVHAPATRAFAASAPPVAAEAPLPAPLAPVAPAPAPTAAGLDPSAGAEASAPPLPAPPAPAVAPAQPRACADQLSAGDLPGAVRCYQRQAAGSGLAAETALYELGRLRRDRERDLPGALAVFAECRRRFPHGALAVEASLSIIDLLPRLGRPREALDESARLLAAHPALERADELHLLRGNLLRQALGDCGGAIREYRAVGPGRSADAAAFFHATCLADLGRRAEAAAALRAYLARPDAARPDEARRRLEAITR
jgi:hypothetical protein